MMVVSFPGIDKNDLTQQLITNCFEIMRSPGNPEKSSYIAASLIEWTKRDTYRWAIRHIEPTDNEETPHRHRHYSKRCSRKSRLETLRIRSATFASLLESAGRETYFPRRCEGSQSL